MVHMCVGQEHSVDVGKIADAHSGNALTAQQNQPRREDWVDEDIVAADLQQERRVTDEGDRRLVLGDRERQTWLALERIGVALAHKSPELPQFAHPEGDSSSATWGPASAASHVYSCTPLNQMRERLGRCLL